MPPLSVVIPCKNEEESIFSMLTELRDVLIRDDIEHEILVVDNNSTDNSALEAKKVPGVKVVFCEKPGYGIAIRTGVKHAVHDHICKLDADGSYNPVYIKPLLQLLHIHKADLTLGNRFSGGDTHNIKFLHKIIGVPALNFVTNTLFRAPESFDSHCGLRVFKKDIVTKLNLRHDDFSFANEMICKGLKNKIVIKQLPIVLRKDLRVLTTSKIKTIKDGFYALKTILKIRFSRD